MAHQRLLAWQRLLYLWKGSKEIPSGKTVEDALVQHAQGVKPNRFGVCPWTEQFQEHLLQQRGILLHPTPHPARLVPQPVG